eukprot:COSAG01_NODE_5644_length_4120_cov_87.808505_6_plen_193_part_00
MENAALDAGLVVGIDPSLVVELSRAADGICRVSPREKRPDGLCLSIEDGMDETGAEDSGVPEPAMENSAFLTDEAEFGSVPKDPGLQGVADTAARFCDPVVRPDVAETPMQYANTDSDSSDDEAAMIAQTNVEAELVDVQFFNDHLGLSLVRTLADRWPCWLGAVASTASLIFVVLVLQLCNRRVVTPADLS